MKPTLRTLADRLLYALEVRGMKQLTLAKRAGLSSGQISHLVAGNRGVNVGFTTLATIADVLDVPVDWLGRGNGPLPTGRADPYPNRAAAVQIARDGGVPEAAVLAVIAETPVLSKDPPVLWWIRRIEARAALLASSPP